MTIEVSHESRSIAMQQYPKGLQHTIEEKKRKFICQRILLRRGDVAPG
jgi:hypothetical protein